MGTKIPRILTLFCQDVPLGSAAAAIPVASGGQRCPTSPGVFQAEDNGILNLQDLESPQKMMGIFCQMFSERIWDDLGIKKK
jgi:hypothetical protein